MVEQQLTMERMTMLIKGMKYLLQRLRWQDKERI